MKKLFDEEFELTSFGRKVTKVLVAMYIIAICFLCFSPQPFKIEGLRRQISSLMVDCVSYWFLLIVLLDWEAG